MNLELKKVKYSESLSEETPAFTCEIWEGKKLLAYCRNDGRGGGNMVDCIDNKDQSRLDNLETESEIFGMVYDHVEIKKHQSKGFVLRKGDTYYTQKFPRTITRMKKAPNYSEWVGRMKEGFVKDGYKVLNRNL